MISKIEAAIIILKEFNKPMQTKQIIDLAVRRGLIVTKGVTPEATLSSDFINENKRRIRRGEKPRFEKTSPGFWTYIGE